MCTVHMFTKINTSLTVNSQLIVNYSVIIYVVRDDICKYNHLSVHIFTPVLVPVVKFF